MAWDVYSGQKDGTGKEKEKIYDLTGSVATAGFKTTAPTDQKQTGVGV